jgi:MFS family permease
MFIKKYCVQIIREFCNGTVADHYGIIMGPSQLNILWSIIVSIFLVGGVTGSLSGGWVADRFGR